MKYLKLPKDNLKRRYYVFSLIFGLLTLFLSDGQAQTISNPCNQIQRSAFPQWIFLAGGTLNTSPAMYGMSVPPISINKCSFMQMFCTTVPVTSMLAFCAGNYPQWGEVDYDYLLDGRAPVSGMAPNILATVPKGSGGATTNPPPTTPVPSTQPPPSAPTPLPTPMNLPPTNTPPPPPAPPAPPAVPSIPPQTSELSSISGKPLRKVYPSIAACLVGPQQKLFPTSNAIVSGGFITGRAIYSYYTGDTSQGTCIQNLVEVYNPFCVVAFGRRGGEVKRRVYTEASFNGQYSINLSLLSGVSTVDIYAISKQPGMRCDHNAFDNMGYEILSGLNLGVPIW